MDRPRFQIDIGAVMIAVATLAVAMACAMQSIAVGEVPTIVLGTHLAAHRHVRARCRAEGRTFAEKDQREVQVIACRVGLPALGLYFVARVGWNLFRRVT